ncbi:MAG: hypothetical protein KGO82_00080 [Bacteroidota bacterium]|nr:hypothetical protein [Bacteroidota bacterium]
MQLLKPFYFAVCFLLPLLVHSQSKPTASKKIESTLQATAKATLAGNQSILLTDYIIVASMNSRESAPDPTRAGSNTVIKFTGTPDNGSEATSLAITFVPDAPLYDKAEYIESTKTIYLTMPVSQYPVVMSEIAQTIDKPGSTKKLKGIWLDALAGRTIGIIQMLP